MSETPLSLREEHALATRRALLGSARVLFAERGYGSTKVDDIAGHARVTRGAFYHHFSTKEEIFTSVFEEVEAEMHASVLEAASRHGLSASDVLAEALSAFFDRCGDPVTRAIAFVEAPTVLGWHAYREIDRKYFLGDLQAAMRAIASNGGLHPAADPDRIAHLVLAAANEAAMLIANATDVPRERERAEGAVRALLAGLGAIELPVTRGRRASVKRASRTRAARPRTRKP